MVQDGKVSEKTVTTGRRTAEWVEVLKGVKVGDVVMLEPGNLQPGQSRNRVGVKMICRSSRKSVFDVPFLRR